MKPILEVRNLSKSYSIGVRSKRYLSLRESLIERMKGGFGKQKKEFWALKDLNFDVFQGDTLGIIGNNGAGKSTLLKIISKITPPSKGYIKARGRVASLLEVGTGFHPELTGRENVFLNGAILGLKKQEIKHRFDEIVDFSGVENFLDTPLKHYSSGMQLRLAFSVAAHLEPEILVVDEVLAVGDANFQKKCLGKMEEVSKSEGRTILFVSHDMEAIERLCKKTIYLKNGGIDYIGDCAEGIQRYFGNSLSASKEYSKESIVECIKISFERNISLKLKYNFQSNPLIPHFGFVISNHKGEPLFASNPTIEQIQKDENYPKRGTVSVEIHTPKLLYGIYTLSIWMGDGIENSFEDINCITFEIPFKSMVNKKTGFIKPTCKYIFN